MTFSLLLYAPLSAQESEVVRWLSFEQLEDSLAVQPKKVFIDFYTDWCAYCRKMDQVIFTKEEVIKQLNKAYYAVRFDAETDSVVTFGGRQFINDQLDKSRNPLHQIAILLALRNGQFSAPTMVILDEDFKVTARYFEYMDSKRLLKALK
ncbi:MAG: thioredoxin family protein [Saprospiraceae bacterium]|jgi:thioredoxin-related protein|nr:thioredoxin family protein [Saprospiraceae bacterium]